MSASRISARGLTFAYSRHAPDVIRDVSVDLPAGAVTTLTGPSGSGKSTLLYLLALMLRASSGDIVWDGHVVTDLGDSERSRIRASQVGFVFQDALLDPARSVIANVCDSALFAGMDKRSAQLRATELLEQFGVGHRVHHRPGEISGGQAQRVALCRALLTDPQVVFADEPTGNLDVESAELVWQTLRKCADQGATVVVSTHDPALVERGDQVVRLETLGMKS